MSLQISSFQQAFKHYLNSDLCGLDRAEPKSYLQKTNAFESLVKKDDLDSLGKESLFYSLYIELNVMKLRLTHCYTEMKLFNNIVLSNQEDEFKALFKKHYHSFEDWVALNNQGFLPLSVELNKFFVKNKSTFPKSVLLERIQTEILKEDDLFSLFSQPLFSFESSNADKSKNSRYLTVREFLSVYNTGESIGKKFNDELFAFCAIVLVLAECLNITSNLISLSVLRAS